MDNYILEQLRAAAAHAIDLARKEDAVPHGPLRGRFREILIDNLLTPWLPPFCQCGMGMIIEDRNKMRQSTQDDVIVYDGSLAPPILKSVGAPEGVFLYNSVLLRLEVKSTLSLAGVRDFVDASREIAQMNVTVQPGCVTKFDSAYNLLVAYASDSKGDTDFELTRLKQVMTEKKMDCLSGTISAICVVGKGFWKLGSTDSGENTWKRLDSDDPRDHLAWLVGMCSSSSFDAHARRLGREPAQGVESGIGAYLPSPFIDVT